MFHGVIHKITLAQFFLRHGVYQYRQPEWYRRDEDQNDESALKVGPVFTAARPAIAFSKK